MSQEDDIIKSGLLYNMDITIRKYICYLKGYLSRNLQFDKVCLIL